MLDRVHQGALVIALRPDFADVALLALVVSVGEDRVPAARVGYASSSAIAAGVVTAAGKQRLNGRRGRLDRVKRTGRALGHVHSCRFWFGVGENKNASPRGGEASGLLGNIAARSWGVGWGPVQMGLSLCSTNE